MCLPPKHLTVASGSEPRHSIGSPPPPFVPQRLQRGRSPAKHPCRMMCHLRPADALLPHTALSSGACPLKSVYSEGRRKVAIGLSGVDMLSIYRRLFSAGKGRVSINQSRSLRLLLPNTCYAKSSLDGGGGPLGGIRYQGPADDRPYGRPNSKHRRPTHVDGGSVWCSRRRRERYLGQSRKQMQTYNPQPLRKPIATVSAAQRMVPARMTAPISLSFRVW